MKNLPLGGNPWRSPFLIILLQSSEHCTEDFLKRPCQGCRRSPESQQPGGPFCLAQPLASVRALLASNRLLHNLNGFLPEPMTDQQHYPSLLPRKAPPAQGLQETGPAWLSH
ncbi:MAG: hypothetical protein IT487_08720 [Chromatiaceae bacterium]|nr:hypothetical protein [Chromatiaceae bacterium]HSO79351.1 hypothetical protein [Chromatiaceae bacterium]